MALLEIMLDQTREVVPAIFSRASRPLSFLLPGSSRDWNGQDVDHATHAERGKFPV
jgi:hypothetical protein